MNTFELINSKHGKDENAIICTIKANSIAEAGLFLAMNFPEYYFLANIIEKQDEKQVKVLMIACEEYYNSCGITTPIEAAILRLNDDIKFINGFMNTTTDWEGTTHKPWKEIPFGATPIELKTIK